jgi:hypothetical protein
MVLLVDKSDHEMIWLPGEDEVSDREERMIQSPNMPLTFVWNPYGCQVADAMPTGEMFTAAHEIRKIFTEIVSLLGVEWREVK